MAERNRRSGRNNGGNSFMQQGYVPNQGQPQGNPNYQQAPQQPYQQQYQQQAPQQYQQPAYPQQQDHSYHGYAQSQRPMQAVKPKRNTLAMISGIIGLIYLIYIFFYWIQTSNTIPNITDTAEGVGTALAMAMIVPHMVLLFLAVIFNVAGWGTSVRGLVLAGAILYAVSGVLMLVYFPFILPSMVLSFIAFAKMKNTR